MSPTGVLPQTAPVHQRLALSLIFVCELTNKVHLNIRQTILMSIFILKNAFSQKVQFAFQDDLKISSAFN